MKIHAITIKNFRSYFGSYTIELKNLNVFVGRNDIGKSTVLEALDIFINEGAGTVKMDKEDLNKKALKKGEKDIEITIEFDDLPNEIVLDSTNKTTLGDEYLLNAKGRLTILKKYPNGGKEKVFIVANHPTNKKCGDLLLKTNKELKALLGDEIKCSDKTKNAVLRASIWDHYKENLNLKEIEVDTTKGDLKDLWAKLKSHLPLYTLFQSDRKNSDGDSEVQDPLKYAAEQILADKDLVKKLNEVADEVEKKLKEVAQGTLKKLEEMNPDISKTLNPVIPPKESLKWKDVFKSVSITGDEGIPINKRGSGVKRLILLNFFRHEAERRKKENDIPSIIYAIEEPETSQHSMHQKKLIDAFIELSKNKNTQVLLTTHSAFIVKQLQFSDLFLITDDGTKKEIQPVQSGQLPYPSLNEVNYLAFDEITEEYHNELYGHIEGENWFNEFKAGKTTIKYIQEKSDGSTFERQLILTEYVRHQIHHPENKKNTRFTMTELKESIELMRVFIDNKNP